MKSDYQPSAHLVGEQPERPNVGGWVALCSVLLAAIAIVVCIKAPGPASVSCDRPAAVQK
jgi:hypothetical protein